MPPIQHAEEIRNDHAQGRKGRRSRSGRSQRYNPHGSLRPPECRGQKISRVPKGEYIDAPRVVEIHGDEVQAKPLAKAAEDLLAEYFRRSAFYEACEHGSSAEWAGKQILGVSKTRANQIRQELGDDPLVWFRSAAYARMLSGTIGRGRATLLSSIADAFFVALVGGPGRIVTIRAEFAGLRTVYLDEIRRKYGHIDREAIYYFVTSFFLWRRK